MNETLIDWQEIAKKWAEKIHRVRELHKPDEDWPDLCAAPDCNFGLYPCGTIKALDGEQ